jgi:dipeptidyl aminopeptidase/acylaminoacyl peptidase
LIVGFILLGVSLPASLEAQEKPPITVDDYDQWKRITSTSLSPDGAWMSYVHDRLEGEDTLYVMGLDTDLSHVVPRGTAPAFSRDSEWVAYQISPPESEDGEGSARQGRPQPPTPGQRPGQGGGGGRGRTMVLRNLATGDSLTFADVASFSFPENTSVLLIRKRGEGDEAGFDGADLVIYDPAHGTSLNLGNVSDYAVNESGTHLAYLVDAADHAGNGLYLLEMVSSRIHALDTDQTTYSELTWNESGDALAALRGEVPEEKVQRENTLLVLTDLAAPDRLAVLDPATTSGFPQGFVLSELSGLNWSDDSDRIFVGIKEQADEREELEDRANVDVYHWADVQPQSVQQVRASRERNRTWSSVVNLDGPRLSFVRLADESMESVSPAGTSRWGIGRDPTPYENDVAWGGSKADYYRVSLDTGDRTPIAEGLGRQMGASDDGTWWLYLKNEQVIARRLASGDEVNLTQSSGVDFVNRQDDHPYELPTYGTAGWTTDGESVVLYDRYDVWEVPLDGSDAINLTQGMGSTEKIRFRVTRMGGGGGGGFGGFGGGGAEDEGIDLDEPVLLTAYGDWTKKSGYFELEKGREPQSLIWLDKSVGRPTKADDSDRILFTQQTFVEFPDYWVSDTRFRNPRKVTDANPQQANFAWSPGRVLIDYVDERGNELQGTLGLPAGYEEGKQYPMLVYFYELSSQRHHSYQGPAYDDRPHMATYASHGYLVFQPEIASVFKVTHGEGTSRPLW